MNAVNVFSILLQHQQCQFEIYQLCALHLTTLFSKGHVNLVIIFGIEKGQCKLAHGSIE